MTDMETADQLRKSAIMDVCDDDDAHMAAEAVRNVVNG